MAYYGIDLGTTYCSVAVSARGVVTRVPLERGGFTLASVAMLDGRLPHAPRVLTGQHAVTRYRDICAEVGDAPPGVCLVRGSKRHMAAGEVPGGPPWFVDTMALHATDVAALLLRALGQYIARNPALPPMDGVVVTHPQRFRNRERRAVAQAAAMAGLRAAALLPEPDAAAYAYGLGRQFGPRGSTFLVFDFGGGTLDVTVMHRTGDGAAPRLDALGSYGVELGGLGVDERLRERLAQRYFEAVRRSDLGLEDLSEASREALLAVAEGMKVQLNAHAGGDTNPLARMVVRTVSLSLMSGEVLPSAPVRLSLAELAEWIADVTERAADCAAEALARAGVPWAGLDEVLLVGGSSWLYPVQMRMRELVAAAAGPAEIVVRLFDDVDDPLNPATAVAAGAARYAEHLAGEGSAVVDYRGVTPDAFGVRAREADPDRPGERREALAILVPARTRVPFEGKRVFRKRGGARVLPIEVLEGSSLAEATPLGCFPVELDAALPDGATVEVTLAVGRDGVLRLSVRDPVTDTARAVTLADAEGLYADDELDERRRWLAGVSVE